MKDGGILYTDSVSAYRKELLRWNKQINLISRQDSAERLEVLLRQSAEGFETVWSALLADHFLAETNPPSGERLWYFDLGSGAGLPGFVWHLALADRCPGARTWLVEPREKRAWFLERLPHACEAPPLKVLTGRWSEVKPGRGDDSPEPLPAVILISLKALHLEDREVLDGLSATLSCESVRSRIVICRYYPADQRLDEDLTRKLGLSQESTMLKTDRLRLVARERGILGTSSQGRLGASLVYSCYTTG